MNLLVYTARQEIEVQTLSAKRFFELVTQVIVRPGHLPDGT